MHSSSIFDFQRRQTIVCLNDFVFNQARKNKANQQAYLEMENACRDSVLHPTLEMLIKDLFHALYLKEIKTRPADFIRLGYLFNHVVVLEVLKSDGYQRLKDAQFSVTGQRDAAFMAALQFAEKFSHTLETLLKTENTQNCRFKKTLKTMAELTDPHKEKNACTEEALSCTSLQNRDGEPEGLRSECRDDMDELMKNNGTKMIHQIWKHMADDHARTENTNELVFGGFMAGSGKGVYIKVPVHQRIELAKELCKNTKVQEIAKFIGHFQEVEKKTQTHRQKDIPLLPLQIEKGDDLLRCLPMEMAGLTHSSPGIRLQTQKRWLNRSLDIFEPEPLENRLPNGKGSMICCLDESGSMAGLPEIKAKGLVLALAQIAHRKKRNFVCLLFSGPRDEVVQAQIAPDDDMEAIATAVTTIAGSFIGGGTAFEIPLLKAMDVLSQDIHRDGDIVFITDGHADLGENFLKRFAELKARKSFFCYGLLIDAFDSTRNQGRKTLERFCNEIFCNSTIEKDPSMPHVDHAAQQIFNNLS